MVICRSLETTGPGSVSGTVGLRGSEADQIVAADAEKKVWNHTSFVNSVHNM
jgi:hypothetical protein